MLKEGMQLQCSSSVSLCLHSVSGLAPQCWLFDSLQSPSDSFEYLVHMLLPLRMSTWLWPSGSFTHRVISQPLEFLSHTQRNSFSLWPLVSATAAHSLPCPIRCDCCGSSLEASILHKGQPLFHQKFSYFLKTYHHFPQSASPMLPVCRCDPE